VYSFSFIPLGCAGVHWYRERGALLRAPWLVRCHAQGPIERAWIAGRFVRGRRGCHLRRRGESELVTEHRTRTRYYRRTEYDRTYQSEPLQGPELRVPCIPDRPLSICASTSTENVLHGHSGKCCPLGSLNYPSPIFHPSVARQIRGANTLCNGIDPCFALEALLVARAARTQAQARRTYVLLGYASIALLLYCWYPGVSSFVLASFELSPVYLASYSAAPCPALPASLRFVS
jgi:hypothetical protein